MKVLLSRLRANGKTAVFVSLFVVIGIAAASTYSHWSPWLEGRLGLGEGEHEHRADDPETVHDHESEGQAAATSLVLSDQGRKNVGLSLFAVELRDFQRTVSVPAVVVERPARSQLSVSTPITGIVTRIYPIRGEAVMPGDPLFDMRLTHQDLVEKQTALLQDLEQSDVIQREIDRLEEVTRSGAVAGKTLLEKQYEFQRIEASIRVEREALLLHGLTGEQIDSIETNRKLVRQILVTTPQPDVSHHQDSHEDFLQVAEMTVQRGQQVQAGEPLAILTDHCELYVEGIAFEQDADALNRATRQTLPVSAVIESNGEAPKELKDLRILYVENQVERDSRALKFYVSLPNQLARNDQTTDGHRFIAWRYRPGQRVQVNVPVQVWTNRIVVPIDAVIKDGAEWFVFQQNGRRFDRKPVHVEYRDQRWAVIENDGTLFPGDMIAATGAYQMHLAMKNKAGGGVDPHAGHNH